MKKFFGFALIALSTSCNLPTAVTPSEEPRVERRLPTLESRIENRSWSCYSSPEFPDGQAFKTFSLSGDGTFSSLDDSYGDPVAGVGLGTYELQNDQLIINFDPKTEFSQPKRGVWTFTVSQVSSKEMIWEDGQVKCKIEKEFF